MVYNQDTGLDSDVMIKEHTKLDVPTYHIKLQIFQFLHQRENHYLSSRQDLQSLFLRLFQRQFDQVTPLQTLQALA